MSPAQRQHIVPEFILNGFSKAGTKRLYGFDKWNDRIFETTPEKAAKENGFYDFEMNGVSASFEEPLQQLESTTAPIIRKLIRNQRLADLSEEEKVGVALFCSVQLLRDKNSLAAGLDFRDKLIEKVNKFRFGPDKEMSNGFQIPSDDDINWRVTGLRYAHSHRTTVGRSCRMLNTGPLRLRLVLRLRVALWQQPRLPRSTSRTTPSS